MYVCIYSSDGLCSKMVGAVQKSIVCVAMVGAVQKSIVCVRE